MSNITLPDLPYAKDALEPHISAETLEYHHDKHHAAYVNKLNSLLPGSGLEGKTLPEIIEATKDDSDKKTMFNQAAQVWNHTFYWNCMTPENGGNPQVTLKVKLMKPLVRMKSSVMSLNGCNLAVWLRLGMARCRH